MSDILQTLAPTTVSLALDANLIAYSSLFGTLPQAQLHEDNDVLWLETGLPDPLFNGILQLRLTQESLLPATLERILTHFKQRNLPFQWHVGPSSTLPISRALLQPYGIEHVEDEPGMAVDLLALNEELLIASHLVIHEVTTLAQIEQWVRVWGGNTPAEIIQYWFTVYSQLTLTPEGPLHLYLGSIDGKPVATTALFFAAGVASINWVVTTSEYRRQGIGAAMTLMAARLARAAHYRVAVLTASPLGIEIYRRLGFREYCQVSTYVWQPQTKRSP